MTQNTRKIFDKHWYFLNSGISDGNKNMEVDGLLLNKAISESIDAPVLRCYGWSSKTLSVGATQIIANEDLPDLPVVKRITGGQAVLHGLSEDELTYSVIAKYPGLTKSFYVYIGSVLIYFLKKYKIDASYGYSNKNYKNSFNCFEAKTPGDIVVDDVKVIGSAQCRKKDFILQHGSIKLDVIRVKSGKSLSFKQSIIDLKSAFEEVLEIDFRDLNIKDI